MSTRIVVDPVTRIEGHLRIEAEIENGIIQDAFSSGTMVRGIEIIVQDRDPREVWAYVGRVCGVCTSIHSLCSVRAVENALGIVIPPNAEMVRNLMQGALLMHDHVVHFYQLQALDWVDVISALKADPRKASETAQSLSDWPKSSPGYFRDIQQKIKKFVSGGQLGIFSNGYWGHPAYKFPPEVNLIGVAHYLEALEVQKDIVKIQTIFGGKNPHPNFLVGGMACAVNINDPNALNLERLSYVAEIIEESRNFIHQVYLPDVIAIASFYPEWTHIGGGLHNYISYGDFPMGQYGETSTYKCPRGIIIGRDLSHVEEFDPYASDGLQEFVNNSWYSYSQGKDVGLHPSVGETVLDYTGPIPPYKYLDHTQPYSWIIEADLVSNWMEDFYIQLLTQIKNGDSRMFNDIYWEPDSWPNTAMGFGLTEAPRGSLAHFVSIENKKVKNYQMVVPTTWNASPRDTHGQRSAFEASLLGTPVHDTEAPLEIIRTIHSFDPCMACSVHLYDESGDHVHQFDTM